MEIISTRKENHQLVSQQTVVVKKMTVFENQIYELSIPREGNSKIKDCDLLTLAEKVSNIATIRLGLKTRGDKEELVFIQTIEADCHKFPLATESEILKALEMGIDGYFDEGKDIFFSSSKFVKWVRTFLETISKPVMLKYAQRLHQVSLPEPPLTKEERIRNAAKIANGYADVRRSNPEYRVVGGAVLFKNLEELGLYTLPPKEKEEILESVKKANRISKTDSIKVICQNTAYNRFIGMLVELEFMLSEKGELINLNQQ